MNGHNDYDPYAFTGKSIRQIVFDLMQGNPQITPSQIVFILHQSFGYEQVNKQTVQNYMMEWRNRNYFQARPPRPHNRTFRWFVVRDGERERVALSVGWRLVSNRNRMFLFRHDYASVHWMVTGNVYVYLRGVASLARAKEAFSGAFWSVLGRDELVKCLDAPICEIGRQWVFDLGQPLPRFDIRHFERSHGLRIYSDGSHPTAVEVAESEPFWLRRMDEIVDTFKVSMDQHLKIIEVFRRESDSRSEELIQFLQKPSVWTRMWRWFTQKKNREY